MLIQITLVIRRLNVIHVQISVCFISLRDCCYKIHFKRYVYEEYHTIKSRLIPEGEQEKISGNMKAIYSGKYG